MKQAKPWEELTTGAYHLGMLLLGTRLPVVKKAR